MVTKESKNLTTKFDEKPCTDSATRAKQPDFKKILS